MPALISLLSKTTFFRHSSLISSKWLFVFTICLTCQYLSISAQPIFKHLSTSKTFPISTSKNQDQENAYVAVIHSKDKDFGNDPQQVSVLINGVPATDVILHNTTAFSFRIPNHMIQNPNILRSSYLQITVGTVRHSNIPLMYLENFISRVHMPTFRREIQNRNLRSTDEQINISQNENHDNEEEKEAFPELPHVTKLLDEVESLLKKPHKTTTTNKIINLLEKAISENSPRAMTMMAVILLGADLPAVKRDIPKAVHYLQSASDQGFPDAQALMGFLYASGIAGTSLRKDIGAAILMWTFAAEGGSMYARMALGYRYFTGTDVDENCEKASIYYRAVADEIYKDTKKTIDERIGRQKRKQNKVDEERPEILPPTPNIILTADRKRLIEGMSYPVRGEANEVFQYYRHLADRGDANAQVVMGNLHYYGGNDIPQDLVQARYRYQQAAENGRFDAYAHLGFMDLRNGKNVSAVDHLKKAADNGNKLGLNGMGFVTLHGIGVPKNPKLAVKYFEGAAEKGHPEALYNLAILHAEGVGVAQSIQRSFQMYQAAAHVGHLQSNYILGVMLSKGVAPVNRDCAQATKYLKIVSQQGPWNKIFSLAFRAYERSSYADALYRYLQAAHAGIELGQYNAAFMYEHNTIQNRDGHTLQSFDPTKNEKRNMIQDREAIVEEALELFQMSASQGYSHSMVRIGDLAFAESKDYSKAVLAYEKAFKLKDPEAMFNLGWMYARGLGTNSDKHMAKRYFDLAKEASEEAVIPATIAVFSLRYFETLSGLFDRFGELSKRISIKWLKEENSNDEESRVKWIVSTPEAITLSILMGALVIVVAARQRRIQGQNVEE